MRSRGPTRRCMPIDWPPSSAKQPGPGSARHLRGIDWTEVGGISRRCATGTEVVGAVGTRRSASRGFSFSPYEAACPVAFYRFYFRGRAGLKLSAPVPPSPLDRIPQSPVMWCCGHSSGRRPYELFRHYCALPSARDKDGRELAAVRGVVLSVLGMLKAGATHVAVATDHVIESFRNDLWPGYKTGAGIDPDLLAQFHPLEDALSAAGIIVWPMVEFEADDALPCSGALAAARRSARRPA